MRHWLTILLMMFLPLQASWAAVAGYCQHEVVTTTTSHFGHHAHQHEAQTAAPDPGAVDRAEPDASSGLSAGSDLDCATCHANCATGLPSVPAQVVPDTLSERPATFLIDPGSAVADALDRPKWVRPA